MMTERHLRRTLQFSNARKALTAFVVLIVMPLFCFFLSSIGSSDETFSTTPTPIPTLTPTRLSERVIVEYQIEVVSAATSELVEFWYTSESNGINQTNSIRVSNSKPFTETVTLDLGEHVEIAGVLANGKTGELTCRILINDLLVAQNTNQGAGTSVYCSGFAFSR